MNLLWLLVVILVIASIFGMPSFGYHNFGYVPSGAGFLIVIILLVLLLR